jgi:hypothetical protein
MILHIILDEKFTELAIRDFVKFSHLTNEFITLKNNQPPKFISNDSIKYLEPYQLITKINQNLYDIVVFHSLTEDHKFILEKLNTKSKIIWFGFGFDYYYDLLKNAYPGGFYLPQTKKILRNKIFKENLNPRLVFHKFCNKFKKTKFVESQKLSFLKKIDYFAPIINTEFDIFKKCHPENTIKYIDWYYGTAEDDFLADSNSNTNKNNILVGNSAFPENNHVEIFELLNRIKHKKIEKIYCPLNYGYNWYANEIEKYGKKLFGNSFVPIRDFMPRCNYLDIVNSCGFVFMNHLRQQASNNALMALLNGSRLFLNPINPMHSWLESQGVKFSSLENLSENQNNNLLLPLGDDDKRINSLFVLRNYGSLSQKLRVEKINQIVRKDG